MGTTRQKTSNRSRVEKANVVTQGQVEGSSIGSQAHAAGFRDRVGVPQSTIGALETGEHKTARNIAEIAAALGVEPLWLSSGKGPKRMDGTLRYVDHAIPPPHPFIG